MSELSSLVGDLAEFSAYVQRRVEEKTQLLSSGVVQRSEELQKFLASGFSSATTDNGEAFIRCIRVKDWAAERLKSCTTGIGSHVAEFESYRLTVQILSILQGALKEQVLFSGTEFEPGVTTLTYSNLEQVTRRHFGLGTLMVHTALYSRLKKNNCLEPTPDPVTGESIQTWGDLRVLWDDNMPKAGNLFTSYLFGQGALGIAMGSDTTVETATDDAGVSQEILIRKWKSCVHPAGFAWKGAVGGGGPTNHELADYAAWRQADDGPARMVKIVTREA